MAKIKYTFYNTVLHIFFWLYCKKIMRGGTYYRYHNILIKKLAEALDKSS